MKHDTLSLQKFPSASPNTWLITCCCLTDVTERVVDGDGHCRAQRVLGFDPHRDQPDGVGHVETSWWYITSLTGDFVRHCFICVVSGYSSNPETHKKHVSFNSKHKYVWYYCLVDFTHHSIELFLRKVSRPRFQVQKTNPLSLPLPL